MHLSIIQEAYVVKALRLLCAAGLLMAGTLTESHAQDASDDGWISLFDGETLDGWRASENPATFRVEDGLLVVDGPRAHLYYVGPVADHDFKNFEFKTDVRTEPGANSGIYIHTEWRESGWPSKGYEIQVNNSHADVRRGGGLYAIDDVETPPAADGEWYTQHIIVRGKRIISKVNGETLVDYTEPEDAERPRSMADRLLSSGTIAIQGHDPESVIYYRNIMVKPLDD